MPQHFQDADLVRHLLLLVVVSHVVSVDALDGYELSRKPVQTKLNFTESSFSQDFPELVELSLALRGLTVLREALLDQLCDEVRLLLPWAKSLQFPLVVALISNSTVNHRLQRPL